MKNQLLKITLIALLSSLAFANSELERKCNNGNAGSCGALGDLYRYGYGVKQDYNKAMEFYGKACEMGEAVGCSALGDLYYVMKDYNKAMEFYGKACEMGEAKGCGAYKIIKSYL